MIAGQLSPDSQRFQVNQGPAEEFVSEAELDLFRPKKVVTCHLSPVCLPGIIEPRLKALGRKGHWPQFFSAGAGKATYRNLEVEYVFRVYRCLKAFCSGRLWDKGISMNFQVLSVWQGNSGNS